jgi:ribosomal protein S18 acetylase RimI-like enzyme
MPHVVQRTLAVKKLFEDDIAGLKAYEAPHVPHPLKFHLVPSATQLKEDEIQACIDLVEETSGADYRASRIGWNTRKKRDEMLDKDMIYLLVHSGTDDNIDNVDIAAVSQADNQHTRTEPKQKTSSHQPSSSKKAGNSTSSSSTQHPQLNDLEQLAQGYISATDNTTTTTNPSTPSTPILGFLSFMFTWDDPPHQSRPVVYIYEIHLSPSLRGQGLGSRLMGFAEHAARACGITKTMLTVFTANTVARKMYERLGYEQDECSPKERVMRSKVVRAEYVIMSKMVMVG